ncbi:IS3 family transposase [Streptococcus pyogenes]|uniref:IS3 family transposase n=1 Tax=Streptococcus pyogenes TaxID=1314 RepID=UPI002ACDE6FA|nr:IS3 family transposase [Streptococcus pyogenes]
MIMGLFFKIYTWSLMILGMTQIFVFYILTKDFFPHLKSESLRLFPPSNIEELIQQIKNCMDWYNYDRPQEILKGMTTIKFREAYLVN